MHYTIADYVLDIAQNSVEAGASEVKIDLDETNEGFRVLVEDNGCGMSEEIRKRALDPFFTDGQKHARRRVGLGLPFLVEAVEQAQGTWSLDSKEGMGTRVEFFFPSSNVDSPPPGDICELLLALLCLPGEHEMLIGRESPRTSYDLRRSELSDAVGGLERASSLALLKEYLVSAENDE